MKMMNAARFDLIACKKKTNKIIFGLSMIRVAPFQNMRLWHIIGQKDQDLNEGPPEFELGHMYDIALSVNDNAVRICRLVKGCAVFFYTIITWDPRARRRRLRPGRDSRRRKGRTWTSSSKASRETRGRRGRRRCPRTWPRSAATTS